MSAELQLACPLSYGGDFSGTYLRNLKLFQGHSDDGRDVRVGSEIMENCTDGFGAVRDGDEIAPATPAHSATEYFDHPSAGREFFVCHFGAVASAFTASKHVPHHMASTCYKVRWPILITMRQRKST